MTDIKEKDLYEPIKTILEKTFSKIGENYFEITASSISDHIKKFLDDHEVLILGTENKRPDIMGIVNIQHETGYISKRLIIIEVKSGVLNFDDIYQLKKYAEMFNAYYAILVSPEGLDETRRRFLKYRNLLLYMGYKTIYIAKFYENDLEYDNQLYYRELLES